MTASGGDGFFHGASCTGAGLAGVECLTLTTSGVGVGTSLGSSCTGAG